MRFYLARLAFCALFSAGCSTAFAQYELTTLYKFGLDIQYPASGLIADAQGNLYGTTIHGGTEIFGGVVYKIAAGTNERTTVVNFTGMNGRAPLAGLILDAAGNLYGTTSRGGTTNSGTVFKIDGATHQLTTLASFSGTDGFRPTSRLFRDSQGNLFGTTSEGGAHGLGTVFKVDAATHSITTLVNFDGMNGADPQAGLVRDANGNLWGTTAEGGTSSGGTIFKLDAATNSFSTIVNFSGVATGRHPYGELLVHPNGNFYGAADDMIYKIDGSTYDFTALARLDPTQGQSVHGALVADAAGNLYGTTYHGGIRYGTVFELDIATNEVSTLVAFDGSKGANPIAGLLIDAAGNLYGTTTDNFIPYPNSGSVFKLSPVPEPSSFVIALLGGVALAMCRGRIRTRFLRPPVSLQ